MQVPAEERLHIAAITHLCNGGRALSKRKASMEAELLACSRRMAGFFAIHGGGGGVS